MRVLLTGGMGFIGSHTAVSLLEAGHEPILYDNLSNADRKYFVTSILKLSFTLPALKR